MEFDAFTKTKIVCEMRSNGSWMSRRRVSHHSHTYSVTRNMKNLYRHSPISIHIDEEDGNKIRICVCVLMVCHTVISIIGYECCLFFLFGRFSAGLSGIYG